MLEGLRGVKKHLDLLIITPEKRITKAQRVEIDKANLLVLSFIGKWLEKRLASVENENRVDPEAASGIVHMVMEHVIIKDKALGFKLDCEVEHDDIW